MPLLSFSVACVSSSLLKSDIGVNIYTKKHLTVRSLPGGDPGRGPLSGVGASLTVWPPCQDVPDPADSLAHVCSNSRKVGLGTGLVTPGHYTHLHKQGKASFQTCCLN